MKRLLLLPILLLSLILPATASAASPAGVWKMHPALGVQINQIVDTPDLLYYVCLQREYNPYATNMNEKIGQLFRYDKKSDEAQALTLGDGLSGTEIDRVVYNPDKKYLLIIYRDANIDLLYDDGRVENIPTFKATSMTTRKVVNNVAFDPDSNRAYLATNFGYLALDDEKYEIVESRNYNTDITAAAGIGDRILLAYGGQLYGARLADRRTTLNDYVCIGSGLAPIAICPIDNKSFFTIAKSSISSHTFTEGMAVNTTQVIKDGSYIAAYKAKGGWYLDESYHAFNLSNEGKVTRFVKPADINYGLISSWDGAEFFTVDPTHGMRSLKRENSAWTVTRDYARPDAPATGLCSALNYSPTYGMVAVSSGIDRVIDNTSQRTVNNISALKNGFWKEYGPGFTNPDAGDFGTSYTGLSVDPDKPNIIYRTSFFNGILRLNLNDPQDIIHFSHPADPSSSKPSYVKIADDQPGYAALCKFTPLSFDSYGNAWSSYNEFEKDEKTCTRLYFWPADDRKATTSPSNARPWKYYRYADLKGETLDVCLALKTSANRNVVVFGGFIEGLHFLDHNGTLDDQSDDRMVTLLDGYDQDGGSVNIQYVYCLYEDPSTGLLWIGTSTGLYTVNPAKVFENPDLVQRIKVARNDGTQLADYLLNQIKVTDITSDAQGRKWFSTVGGVTVTTSDGRQIIAEYNTSNSGLPSDEVYATCHNPDAGSMMLATSVGLVEFFPSGSSSGSAGSSAARIFPNPVEPDYLGWVTLADLPTDGLVKITDAQGGLVKELKTSLDGLAQWDVTGLDHKRVRSGVYYVFVSSYSGTTQAGRILVLN